MHQKSSESGVTAIVSCKNYHNFIKSLSCILILVYNYIDYNNYVI